MTKYKTHKFQSLMISLELQIRSIFLSTYARTAIATTYDASSCFLRKVGVVSRYFLPLTTHRVPEYKILFAKSQLNEFKTSITWEPVLSLENGRQVHTELTLLALIWYLWGLSMTLWTNLMESWWNFFIFYFSKTSR